VGKADRIMDILKERPRGSRAPNINHDRYPIKSPPRSTS